MSGLVNETSAHGSQLMTKASEIMGLNYGNTSAIQVQINSTHVPTRSQKNNEILSKHVTNKKSPHRRTS